MVVVTFHCVVIEVVEVLHCVALELCIVGQKMSTKLFVDLLTVAELIAPSSWMIVHIGE